jgi:hypothetical protein
MFHENLLFASLTTIQCNFNRYTVGVPIGSLFTPQHTPLPMLCVQGDTSQNFQEAMQVECEIAGYTQEIAQPAVSRSPCHAGQCERFLNACHPDLLLDSDQLERTGKIAEEIAIAAAMTGVASALPCGHAIDCFTQGSCRIVAIHCNVAIPWLHR